MKNEVSRLDVSTIILSLLIITVLLGFNSLTSEYFLTTKLFLLILIIPLIHLIWFFEVVFKQEMKFQLSRLSLPVLLLGIYYIITFIINPYITESFFSPSGAGVMIMLVFLYFYAANKVGSKTGVIYPLLTGLGVLAVFSIISSINLLSKLIPWEIFNSLNFTPTGNPLTTIILLISGVPLCLEIIPKENGENTIFGKIVSPCIGIIFILGILASIFILTKTKLTWLPYSTAWKVAVGGLGEVKTAMIGVGPGNYVDIFTQAKTISFNKSPFWNLRFNNSASFLLQTVTETGLNGLVIFLYIIYEVLRNIRRDFKQGIYLSLLIMVGFLTFFPADLTVLFFFFMVFALYTNRIDNPPVRETGIILPFILVIVTVLLSGLVYWKSYRFLEADLLFSRSLREIRKDEGVKAYQTQIKVVGLSPYNQVYRMAFSRMNLALANALAVKENLSDKDKQDISVLIQQAIREAKVAVSLNPNRVANWENLAYIYQSLLNAIEGEGEWTVIAYNEAIKLDPLNPQLRLNIGAVFYQMEQYDQAMSQFQVAANLKYDLVDVHYYLSRAYSAKGDYSDAIKEMQLAEAMVDVKSTDFPKIQAELESLKKKASAKSQINQMPEENLTETGSEGIKLSPKLELPKEATVPARTKD